MKKTIALLFAGLLAQYAGANQSTTNRYPLEVVQAARSFFGEARADISGELNFQISKDIVGTSELRHILQTLDVETNKIDQAAYGSKLLKSSNQIEAVRGRLGNLLSDPGNKETFNLDLLPDEWMAQIKLETAEEGILLSRISRLRVIVTELLDASAILEGVAPPPQLSDRLKTRLGQIAKEWQPEANISAGVPLQSTVEPNPEIASSDAPSVPPPAPATAASVPPAYRPPLPAPAWTLTSAPSASPTVAPSYILISAAAAQVVRMVRSRTPEAVILHHIQVSPTRYSLTQSQVDALVREISPTVLNAMIDHDTYLLHRAQAPGLLFR